MKTEYLNTLRELLNRYQMEEVEKDDIINDYDDMYENYLDYGMTDEEVEEKLGTPKSIIGSLVEGYKRVPTKQSNSNKIIAVMPFISLIIFFVWGFVFDGWVYSWMAFLLIPVTAITLEMGKKKDPHVFTALSPFVATVVFFVLGFGYNLWHPAWVVFLVIPVMGIFNSRSNMKFLELLTALSPFAAILVFVWLGVQEDLWHPGWIVFLIIPAIGLLNEKDKIKVFISEVLLLGGAAAYLYLGYTFENMWGYGAVAFLPLVLYLMYTGHIQLWDKEAPKGYKIVITTTVAVYFLISFLTNWWEISWLIFFAIPVYAILREADEDSKIIAISPFVAVTIFMLLGFILNAWAWSWIAFLIIPLVAIIKD